MTGEACELVVLIYMVCVVEPEKSEKPDEPATFS